ncbi:serine/threonine-protein kinase [Paractinoplanes ferrugineus]|uniref:Serine/threonine protein kinase n=1 Tax=Paractinoplanes ferrugineus TaxID=113564 RepID=A0A919MCL6_9ACTN|nr:serine/threonine-protein kinase [Actinoplanes ferrugineus]GIE14851.1 serine/threonine protein kinase [Actinoplanes ferrugineus]
MPAKIGRYRVERRLGSGAFATVWLAEDDVLESWVAIKVLADNWAHQADVRARFEQEAQVLRRADSERLVRIHDYGELPDGRPFQVMTYADGGTLAERLDQGPMPVRTALRIAADIARATADLHSAGVLHRDLKPSNVLFGTVRGTERVLVADLGLAKSLAFASGFTVVAGTPGYMAPEQSRPGGGLDERADIHAIGAMTYQMLTGRQPRGAAGPPSKLRPGVSPTVDRIVLRALAADRDRRWPTAAGLADALQEVAGAPAGRRNRASQIAGRTLGGLLALAGLALLGGTRPAHGTPPGWTRVADESRTISIAVPSAWAGQARQSGWNPAAVGLPPTARPGLAVAGDLRSWGEEYSGGPGVFVGTADSLERATLPTHARCTRWSVRTVPGAQVTRWAGCAGTTISYSEVVAGRTYLQIKQVGDPDLTDRILHTIRS